MAVTKILARGGSYKQLLEYIADEKKITYLPEKEQTGYIKSRGGVSGEGEVRYISGHNCSSYADDAYDDMQATKKRFGKMGGIKAHHLIQSFKPGETDPETAHKIALELAAELFPDFEVLITTHLDKGHIHNHFAINSVKFTTGEKFSGKQGSKTNYWTGIRQVSDKLCRKYNLSVIEKPTYGEGRKYPSYKQKRDAERNLDAPPSPADRTRIKADIDAALSSAVSKGQFMHLLRDAGYGVKERGKYWSILPDGRQKYIRVNRKTFLGDAYSLDQLEKTFAANKRQAGIYRVVRGQFYNLGLYGKYYNAFLNAGIIKRDDGNKMRLRRAEGPARLPEYEEMNCELNLMRAHGVRTHKDLIILRHNLKEKLKEVDDNDEKAEEIKAGINEAIEITRRIERRSIEQSMRNEKTERS